MRVHTVATQTNEIMWRLERGDALPPPPNKIGSEWLPERLELPLLPNPASEQEAGGYGTVFCLHAPFWNDPTSKGRGH